jgi:hypothetical protein
MNRRHYERLPFIPLEANKKRSGDAMARADRKSEREERSKERGVGK